MTRLQDALRLRDRVLQLMQGSGVSRDQMWERDGFKALLNTPFNPLPGFEPAPPTYDHAVALQRAGRDMSYQLNVWCGPKVLLIEWGADARIVSFKRGEWESRLLALDVAETRASGV